MDTQLLSLSEAIRLGSLLRPQCKRHWYGLTATGEIGSCALGAAAEAVSAEDLNSEQLCARFPILVSYVADPFGGAGEIRMSSAIVRLNDVRGWPRWRIADWVAERERELAKAKQPAQVEAEQAVLA